MHLKISLTTCICVLWFKTLSKAFWCAPRWNLGSTLCLQLILKPTPTLEGEAASHCSFRSIEMTKKPPDSPELSRRVASSPGCTAPAPGAPCCHPHKAHGLGSKTRGLHQATVSVPGELQPTVWLSSHFWENKTWNLFQHQVSWKIPRI